MSAERFDLLKKAYSIARKVFIGALAIVAVVGLTRNYYEPEAQTASADKPTEAAAPQIRPLPADDVDSLALAVNAEWQARKSPDEVPSAAPLKFPGGLERMEPSEKKTLFFRALLPHVLQVNKTIKDRRAALESLAAAISRGEKTTDIDAAFVSVMVSRYMTSEEYADWRDAELSAQVEELLRRVDEVPPSLVLAQAALESAWGSSRFAIEGNNLFGVWVYNAAKGMIPRERADGATHAVAKYDSIAEAVETYFDKLNTLWAYEDFREIRARMRQEDEKLDSGRLAEGLVQYSARADDYVQDVQNLIRSNSLMRFDDARLAKPPAEKPSVTDVKGKAPANGKADPSDA